MHYISRTTAAVLYVANREKYHSIKLQCNISLIWKFATALCYNHVQINTSTNYKITILFFPKKERENSETETCKFLLNDIYAYVWTVWSKLNSNLKQAVHSREMIQVSIRTNDTIDDNNTQTLYLIKFILLVCYLFEEKSQELLRGHSVDRVKPNGEKWNS